MRRATNSRTLASIFALGGLTTAACGDDGVTGLSTTGGEDDSTSDSGGGPAFTTAVTTADDTASTTAADTGDTGTSGETDTSTGETPDDSTGGACGNGIVDAGETCDGDDLDGTECTTLGYESGTLGCAADCASYDESQCVPAARCGDGFVDDGEACDSGDLNGATCETEGFDAGTLACTAECELDSSACVLFSCGNGILEDREACDGDDLDGATCDGLGFGPGEVVCDAQCALDTSACCGDGQIGGTEACDETDLDGQTCASLGHPGGTLTCAADCGFDESACSVCGDATIGDGEACDGAELGGADCTTIGMGFAGGTLACAADTCQYDTSGCNLCGNDVIDAGETCDGSDLGGATCASLGMGFTGGTLGCVAGCELDTTACTSFPVPEAGDVVITEIMYDPSVLADGDGGEWFELYNPSTTDTFELQGCVVEGNSASDTFSIDGPLTIPPLGFLVFAGSADPLAIGFSADVVFPTGFALANAGDLVRISCGGTTVDEVTYDDVAPWPDPPGGQSINLDPDALDTVSNDDGAEWCAATSDYFMGELGTPGALNTDCAAVVDWTIGFCRLQFPLAIDEVAGTVVPVYGRVFAAGLTDQSTVNDLDAQLVAQLGYGPDASDPSADPTAWTWTNATPNAGWDGATAGEPNNDEYQADLVVPAPPPADRDFAYRFSGDGGATWTYCDGDSGGSTTGYASADAGQLTSSAAPIPDVWFSEYVEGTSNNKAIEIFNGGTGTADLSACELRLYTNGSPTAGSTFSLAGVSLAEGDTWVVCNPSSTIGSPPCDVTSNTVNFNGNDAFELACSGTPVDVIGQIGFDPAPAWSAGGVTTLNATIRRQCSVTAGDPDGSDEFDPSLEWSAFPQDDFTDLGAHTCP